MVIWDFSSDLKQEHTCADFLEVDAKRKHILNAKRKHILNVLQRKEIKCDTLKSKRTLEGEILCGKLL